MKFLFFFTISLVFGCAKLISQNLTVYRDFSLNHHNLKGSVKSIKTVDSSVTYIKKRFGTTYDLKKQFINQEELYFNEEGLLDSLIKNKNLDSKTKFNFSYNHNRKILNINVKYPNEIYNEVYEYQDTLLISIKKKSSLANNSIGNNQTYFKYNSKGNLISKENKYGITDISYHDFKKMKNIITRKNDKPLTKIIKYYKKQKLISLENYYYNDKWILTKKSVIKNKRDTILEITNYYKNDSILRTSFTKKYQVSLGKVIDSKVKSSNMEDLWSFKDLYLSEECKVPLEKIDFNLNGKSHNQYYNYNDQGDVILDSLCFKNNRSQIDNFTSYEIQYQYDNHNNWIEKRIVRNNKIDNIQSRSISYYKQN